jgi:hypothetical protein
MRKEIGKKISLFSSLPLSLSGGVQGKAGEGRREDTTKVECGAR